MPVELSAEVRFGIALPKTAEVQAELRRAMKDVVATVLQRARQNLSGRFVRVRSGRGLSSLRTSVRATPDGAIGTVGSPLFYLRILHTGFPAQELVTKKTGFAFFRGGHLIRSKRIHHPGVTARPWLQTALEESHDDIIKAFDQAAVNIGRFVASDGRAA